jgi:hypothetical protein
MRFQILPKILSVISVKAKQRKFKTAVVAHLKVIHSLVD